jgi:hypothetical protein
MTFVSKLYPWSQWRLDLHVPQDKPAKRWHLHPALAVERSTLRKVQQFPQGYAYLYLNHPKEELCQAGHSSPMLRYLFHRFAIILFKATSIRRWQIGDSQNLQRIAKLADTNPMTYTCPSCRWSKITAPKRGSRDFPSKCDIQTAK